MQEKTEQTEVAIIGGGPAGIAAALWCSDLGLSNILIDAHETLGGQLHRIYNPITNYPAFLTITGGELSDKLAAQLSARDIDLRAAHCESIDVNDRTVMLSGGPVIRAGAIIIATGVRRRRLGIPGEMKFAGCGVLDSGARSKSELSGKKVVIVGGGDAAFENALILSETADCVTVVHRGGEPRARREFLASAERRKNVQIVLNTQLVSIEGDEAVRSVRLQSPTGDAAIEADAVLIRIGVEPNSDLVRGQVATDQSGYIKIDSNCRTSVAGVYAAGDIAAPTSPTIATAVGMGAASAKTCYEWLRRRESPPNK